jgi:hypothetical protein
MEPNNGSRVNLGQGDLESGCLKGENYMSKKKLNFNKLAASGAVVAGCLGYCGVVGVGVATLSGSDMCAAAQPLRDLGNALGNVRRDPNMGPHIQKLEALQAKIVERNQGQGDSEFGDFVDKAFRSLCGRTVGRDYEDEWQFMKRQYPQLYRHIEDIQRGVIRGGENKELPFGHIHDALEAASCDWMRKDLTTKQIVDLLGDRDFMSIKYQIERLTRTVARLFVADGARGNTSRDFVNWVHNATDPTRQSRPMPQGVGLAVRGLEPDQYFQDLLIRGIDDAVEAVRQLRAGH